MASSQDSPPVLSSSPLSISIPHEYADGAPKARHSPTFPRSFDPNDPQVREIQRTMDEDMALQLSRARRETIHHSPETSAFEPAAQLQRQPSPELNYTPMSAHEEREIDLARGTPDVGMILTDDATIHRRSSPSLPSLIDARHLHAQADNSTSFTALNTHTSPPQLLPQEASPRYELPTYQANVPRSSFDFSKMEGFAAKEKAILGLSSPLAFRARQVDAPIAIATAATVNDEAQQTAQQLPAARETGGDTPPLLSPSSTQVPSSPGNGDEPSRLLRHRKLSQSNPQPRTNRRGIGGKLAAFESNNNGDPFNNYYQAPRRYSLSARLGAVLGAGGSAGGPDHFVPSSGRGVGILNTGHDRPFRFSFYSNSLAATIHSRSLSELPADGQSFKDLFSGFDPPPADDRWNSRYNRRPGYASDSKNGSGGYGPNGNSNRDTDSTTWWLDVTSPTEEEMKMLSEVFSIHPLTTEDILMEETREKIELFRNYYFVCFRSFDQDQYSPTYLEPLNMYIIVFREGILSFHFQFTPHPQNVRRRIKQFKDYISVTSDWISYALIDDITDAFGPLIQGIEYEVDSIDELVLILKEAEQTDMLRRIGTCRKKVMGLLRLMGNKADVVKGLAKRCNENWRVAPTSDIGLYLSDIQDHLITMTQNLNHYEKILSRSHSNYLAQISIEMTDANNQINDVLSKLTALGTVLIPMNLVTGLWGMNVHVPGQDVLGYNWFIAIIACLAAFALIGGYGTYKFLVRK